MVAGGGRGWFLRGWPGGETRTGGSDGAVFCARGLRGRVVPRPRPPVGSGSESASLRGVVPRGERASFAARGFGRPSQPPVPPGPFWSGPAGGWLRVRLSARAGRWGVGSFGLSRCRCVCVCSFGVFGGIIAWSSGLGAFMAVESRVATPGAACCRRWPRRRRGWWRGAGGGACCGCGRWRGGAFFVFGLLSVVVGVGLGWPVAWRRRWRGRLCRAGRDRGGCGALGAAPQGRPGCACSLPAARRRSLLPRCSGGPPLVWA